MKIADYGFLSLFAYEEYLEIKYAFIDGYLCIVESWKGGDFHVAELLGKYDEKSFEETVGKVFDMFEKAGIDFCFRYIPEEDLDKFRRLKNFDISYSFTDDDSDYLYEKKTFLELSGNSARHKREHYNYFLIHYPDHSYEALSLENMELCMDVMNKWCFDRDCSGCRFGCEKKMVRKILDNFKKLDCIGCIVKVNGVPSSFIIGEKINNSVMMYYFAKADKSIYGLNVFTFMEFGKRVPDEIKFFNLAEDMGLPGLRQYKQIFKPYTWLSKYNVYLKRK